MIWLSSQLPNPGSFVVSAKPLRFYPQCFGCVARSSVELRSWCRAQFLPKKSNKLWRHSMKHFATNGLRKNCFGGRNSGRVPNLCCWLLEIVFNKPYLLGGPSAVANLRSYWYHVHFKLIDWSCFPWRWTIWTWRTSQRMQTCTTYTTMGPMSGGWTSMTMTPTTSWCSLQTRAQKCLSCLLHDMLSITLHRFGIREYEWIL